MYASARQQQGTGVGSPQVARLSVMPATRDITRIFTKGSSPHDSPHHRYEGSETVVSLNLRLKNLLGTCVESNKEREEEDAPQANAQRSRMMTVRVGRAGGRTHTAGYQRVSRTTRRWNVRRPYRRPYCRDVWFPMDHASDLRARIARALPRSPSCGAVFEGNLDQKSGRNQISGRNVGRQPFGRGWCSFCPDIRVRLRWESIATGKIRTRIV